ncbi:hypothetical protein Aph02nite_14030 [Actinoplanes philippinensis]|uniref:hypothetical protein n=1 Tax=Actinoplanes philippinensis TaxID=35752 RepID=UPI0011609EA3|nr:hypothetical protein [Actinoplanes philippinensis]GIE75453.1 hypothetical protein Aph02nite_14030 [Actinoplanes philippinensis]
MTGARTPASRLVKAGLAAAAVVLGAGVAPLPANADGPGYGGNADALTVIWEVNAQRRGLAVYAVGFRGGSSVRVRIGSDAERTVIADQYGAVDLLFIATIATSTSKVKGTWKLAAVTTPLTGTPAPSGSASTPSGGPSAPAGASTDGGVAAVSAATGASVLVSGHTPAGELRTLIGAVPPEMTDRGAAELIPWVVALAGSLMAGLWLRRRYAFAVSGNVRRYRHPGRHRA